MIRKPNAPKRAGCGRKKRTSSKPNARLSSPEPYPAWFDKILDSSGADVPSAAPEDPNDWWDDEDWELCETGLCAEDDLPCPCTTVPRDAEDP